MCSILFSTRAIQHLDTVNHYIQLRGPDATAHVQQGRFNFVHNLLSMTGSFTIQPIVDNDCFLLFNGEIYNFQSFGDFDNDSKCIIPAYRKYGTEFARRFDGEFAIVLVDFRTRRIIITTDTFASKPLWLACEEGDLAAASYNSPLVGLGFKQTLKVPGNTTFVISLDTLEILTKRSVTDFDIENQHKRSFDDWNKAFAEAIRKRAVTNVRQKIFIGMSSGYDSGAIACELLQQHVPYKIYTATGAENRDVLQERFERAKQLAEIECFTITPEQRDIAHRFIENNVEEFKYRVYSASSDYNEFNLRLQDDNGSNHLSHLCSLARRDGRRIYLSGMGADEIFSDYGFRGVKKYPHSNFGGLFPDDLRTIFPWPSFYESTMVSYLTKEEYVAGSYGLEARYPFLDRAVVQEFLWLHPSLKNAWYKSVLHNYLTQHKFPFSPNEKIGF